VGVGYHPAVSVIELLSTDAEGLARAAELLRGGQVIAFPTDTVYGLAALAGHPAAVRQIYEIKGRPAGRPLILMVHEAAMVGAFAEVDERARAYMDRHWPGPLTLVLRARPHLCPPLVTGRPPTVGVRIPDHPLALALLARVGEPLATTSANLSGQPEARDPETAACLDGLAAVIDGGQAPGGVPSTVLDLSGAEPRVLRAGPLTASQLHTL
jgi:L-threonylcarbamoyladenylate synthase